MERGSWLLKQIMGRVVCGGIGLKRRVPRLSSYVYASQLLKTFGVNVVAGLWRWGLERRRELEGKEKKFGWLIALELQSRRDAAAAERWGR